MGKEDLRGKISIEHATRRGASFIDAANHVETPVPSSSRKGVASPSDGVAEAAELRHAMHVADLVHGGLDNHRGVPSEEPKTEKF